MQSVLRLAVAVVVSFVALPIMAQEDVEAPAPAEPSPTNAALTDAEPVEPAPVEPAPVEPAPAEPEAVAEPAPAEPAPTEPAPAEPAPTESAPTEPAPPSEDIEFVFDDGADAPTTDAPATATNLATAAASGTPKLNYFTLDYLSRFYSDTWWTNSDEYVIDWQNFLTLGVDIDPGFWKGRIHLDARFRHRAIARAEMNQCFFLADSGQDCRAEYDITPMEMYVDAYVGPVDIRVGNQLFAWNFTEFISPSRFINPFDLRNSIIPDPKFSQLPVLAASATIYPVKELEITAVLIPFFTEPQAFIYGDDNAIIQAGFPFPLPLTGPEIASLLDPSIVDRVQSNLAVTRAPDQNLRNMSGALRMKYNYGDGDAQLVYGYYFSQTPFVKYDPDLAIVSTAISDARAQAGPNLTPQTLNALLQNNGNFLRASQRLTEKVFDGQNIVESYYQRQHYLSGAWRHSVEGFTLKTEVGFQPNAPITGPDGQSDTTPTITGVFGLDYEYAPYIVAIMEVYGVYAPSNDIQPAFLFKKLDGAPGWILPGVLLGARSSVLDETLNFEVIGISQFLLGDLILQAKAVYKVTDQHQVGLGTNLFFGPDPLAGELTPGGYFSRNSQVFLQYNFLY